MKSKVYSIRDKKLAVYGRPFMASEELVAKRAVAASLMGPDNQMCMFATDYELVELGSFDDKAGKYEIYEHSMHVCELQTLVNWIEMIQNANKKKESEACVAAKESK